ncbi:MAG: glycosyltransferase family 39 protein, partial [FCB group bacterium]|nr:glycosyltransferase family 39 protein [FCB group bacterium]
WATFSPSLRWRIEPSAVWAELQFHLLALSVFLVFIGGVYAALRRLDWFDNEPDARAAGWLLVGLIFFGVIFSCSIAMLREGTAGIADAYSRYQYEYIGDIGFGRTLKGLFTEYASKHEFLSIHAKVHPPGPIALLWVLSFVAGREALGLSLATIAVGTLAVVPLYYWVTDLLGRRAALTACMLYTLMPSIVLFTATSADILFMPFTIVTLFLFGRAMDRASIGYAVAAGVAYAVASLLSFSLLTLGAYFAFVGLWRLRARETRFSVVQTAVVMLLAFLGLHLAVRLWSGFDVVEVFRLSKAQFDLDQHNLEKLLPRYPSWTWKILNPLAWVYFAGIPVSVLFFWRLAKPEAGTKALFVVFALTLVVLDLAYLARGEGERSAMYILPFVVVPAAHAIDRMGQASGRLAPLVVTLCALAFQCWFTEVLFYTYW